MSEFKCKMCGGNVIVSADNSAIGTCENCGTMMTIPSISDEQKTNLFNRANHFRRLGDFDKALSSYEHILSEDDNIAEAHWGVVLCRYGIEYVEDPESHAQIPTCHRTSYDSIFTDLDYTQAIRYADPVAKELYEAEAKEIDRLQKDILAISKTEEPYDIFISYKETTDGGSRTKDSVLAQDLYDRLTKEGYRVFFSRISLEDKVGQQYEPYIFSALNSAKVMLVVGTDRDNFNAVWVRNEWSRYLSILKKQGGRLLIPCYRDMDVYDLPEELSVFQCQDMSKLGYEQDLIHGIKKIVETSEETNPGVNTATAPTVASLLKRAGMFLQDCNWEKADEYYDHVLDIDPENGEAYVGKLCVELRATSLNDLSATYLNAAHTSFAAGPDCSFPVLLGEHPGYQKAHRFANESLRHLLEEQEKATCSGLQELGQAKIAEERSCLKNLEADISRCSEQLAGKNEEVRIAREEKDNLKTWSELNAQKQKELDNLDTPCKCIIIGIIVIGILHILSDDVSGRFLLSLIAVGFVLVVIWVIWVAIREKQITSEYGSRKAYQQKETRRCIDTLTEKKKKRRNFPIILQSKKGMLALLTFISDV